MLPFIVGNVTNKVLVFFVTLMLFEKLTCAVLSKLHSKHPITYILECQCNHVHVICLKRIVLCTCEMPTKYCVTAVWKTKGRKKIKTGNTI